MAARNRVGRPSRPLSTYEITLQIQQGISEKEASLLKQLHEASMDKQLNISTDETLLPVSTCVESNVNSGLSNTADANSGGINSDEVPKITVTPLVTETPIQEDTTGILNCDTSAESNEDNSNLIPAYTSQVLEPDVLEVADVEVVVAEENKAVDGTEDVPSTKVTPVSEINHAQQETPANEPADASVDVVPVPETVITLDKTEKGPVILDSHYDTLAEEVVFTAVNGAMVSISEENRSAEVKQEVHEPLSTDITISQTGGKEVLQTDISEIPMDANAVKSINEISNDVEVKTERLDATTVSVTESEAENLPSPPPTSEELPAPPADITSVSTNQSLCELPPPALDLHEPGDLPAPPPLDNQTKASDMDMLPPPPPEDFPSPLLEDDLPSSPDITPIEHALPLPPSLSTLANELDLPPPTLEGLPLPPQDVKVETAQEEVEDMGLPSPPAIVVSYTEVLDKGQSDENNAHVEAKVHVETDEASPAQSDQENKTVTVTESPEDQLPDKKPTDNGETSKELNDKDGQHTTETPSTPKGDGVLTEVVQVKPENNTEQTAIKVPTRGQEQANADKKIKHTKGCCTIL